MAALTINFVVVGATNVADAVASTIPTGCDSGEWQYTKEGDDDEDADGKEGWWHHLVE